MYKIFTNYFNNYIIIFFLILLGFNGFSQKVSVSGYIEDSVSNEKLIGANVFNKTHKFGTATNNYGFYNIIVNKGEFFTLRYSFVGYGDYEINLFLLKDTTINVKLAPFLSLSEVEIIANSNNEKAIERTTEMSVVSIPLKQAKLLPSLGGESDILKAIQLSPGIQQGTEASSGLYVRGGSPDQNLLILDEVPLYYVNHLGGFVSIFNSDAIKNFKLYKAAFPAQYGDRLSSVIDIRMKEGNMQEYHGNFMLGMITTKLSFEGPIKKDTSSFLVSFRRFMYDLITRPLTKIVFDNISVGYTFYDLNLKFNYRLSNKDILFLSVYSSKDKISTVFRDKNKEENYKINSRYRINWGNNLIALRWNHIFNNKLFSNTTLSYSQYKYSTKFNETNNQDHVYNKFSSIINDLLLKTDFEYFISNNYKLKFGFNTSYHYFIPRIEDVKENANDTAIDTTFFNIKTNSFNNNIYIENIIHFTPNISCNIGSRFVHYAVSDTNFFYFEPRVLLNFLITKNTSIKASYSKMHQNLHLLVSEGAAIPADLWLPATKEVEPENSDQFAIGVASTINCFNQIFEINSEVFYKSLNNLIAHKSGSDIFNLNQEWYDKIEKNGTGTSKGIEFFINKKSGKTTGWIGYTLSKTTRKFENINDGKPYNFKYDRTHDFNIVLIYNFNDNVNLSASWIYATGNCITLPIGSYSILTEDGLQKVYIYDGINTIRMKDYHKLDVGINFSKQKKRGVRTWNISIYNVYNRQNPSYYYFSNYNGKIHLWQECLFPIMPSISYSYSF